jgi:FkbM family methyltransferase
LFNKKINKIDIIKNSKSQINQDLFVIAALNFIKKGFFIEIGAADGLNLSNSYLLEKKFNWNGILCEPSTIYEKLIKKNRKSKIETKCIYNRNTKIKFLETAYPMLSTMKSFSFSDHHKKLRNELINHNCIKETISVNKFLQKHNCPINIDYLSIDTEGSEYLILKNFNLKKYNIKIITIEHNFTSNRKKIQNYLFKNNYLLVKINTQHDDWYIKKEIYNKIISKLKDKIIYSDFIYRH